LTQARPMPRSLMLAVKTGRAPSAILPAIRAEVSAVDSELPIVLPQSLDEAVSNLNGPQRLATVLLTLFAGLALLLAAVGIYATISQSVAQRRNEIGIRMALGATASDVLRAVMADGLKVLVAGVAIGTGISLVAAHLLSRFLYRVSPTDPATLALAAVVLSCAALLASYLPARQACKIDPARALR